METRSTQPAEGQQEMIARTTTPLGLWKQILIAGFGIASWLTFIGFILWLKGALVL